MIPNIRAFSFLTVFVMLLSLFYVSLSIETAYARPQIYDILARCPSGQRLTILQELNETDVFRGTVRNVVFTDDKQIADVRVPPVGPVFIVKVVTGRSDSDFVFELGQTYRIYGKNMTGTNPEFAGFQLYEVRPCTNTVPDDLNYYHNMVVSFLIEGKNSLPFNTTATLDGNEYTFVGRTNPSVLVKGASITLGSNVSFNYTHPGESGILEVSLPKSIIDGITEVKVKLFDGGYQDAMVEMNTTNSTHTTIALLAPNSTIGVVFYGTHVVPEFAPVLMILAVIATITATIRLTRTRQKMPVA